MTGKPAGQRLGVVRRAGLQFHAAGPEVIEMAAGWAREYSLYAAFGGLFEDRAVGAENGDFVDALAVVPGSRFLLLNQRPMQVPAAASLYDLVGLNDGCLVLQLGEHHRNELHESSLGTVTNDPHALQLWRRLINRARRAMRSGTVVTNPTRGIFGRLPSHRYTDEAFHLQATGVRMLALGGGNIYRLTPDASTRPLPDEDLLALSALTSVVESWVTNELLAPELSTELMAQLARRNVLARDASAGELVATLLDLMQALNYAFGGEPERANPRPRRTCYSLHLPGQEQADAVGSALAQREDTRVLVRARDRDRQGDAVSNRAFPWEVSVTLPGMAPDPAHRRSEARLIELARAHGGVYAGWRR